MVNTDKVFSEMFNHNDLILICDVHGKIMFYEDHNDQINMMKSEKAIGKSVLEKNYSPIPFMPTVSDVIILSSYRTALPFQAI